MFAGLVKLRELVRSRKSQDMEVYLRQADLDSYRQVLTEIKAKEIRNLIVDTKAGNMHHFLRMVKSRVPLWFFLYVIHGYAEATDFSFFGGSGYRFSNYK